MARNEVVLLKHLIGPTFIHCYDCHITDTSISLMLEYAEGGNVSERIQALCERGEEFDKEVILDWTAQVSLGLMVMHAKKLLHRNLKVKNLFLARTGGREEVKIGGFNIARMLKEDEELASTYCGTPQYMSPEVIRGESYSDKADMWALGCVIYELAALRRPFDGSTTADLYVQINKQEFAPLPFKTDPFIRGLVEVLLNKDPVKRPSVWEFIKIPEVRRRIEEFVKSHDYDDEVLRMLEKKQEVSKSLPFPKLVEEEKEAPAEVVHWKYNKSDKVLVELKKNVKLQDAKVEWTRIYKDCVTGSELMSCALKSMGGNAVGVINTLQKLMNKGLFHSVDGTTKFANSDNALYKFEKDEEGKEISKVISLRNKSRDPLSVSAELLAKAISIYNYLSKDTDEEKSNTEHNESSDLIKLEEAANELQEIDLLLLNKEEKVKFFLNVYQTMYLHFLFKHPPQRTFTGVVGKSWDGSKVPEFAYNVGGMSFTLDDVKHGVLRGNKKAPGAVFRTFCMGDKRNVLHDVLCLLPLV
eukprot:TRINITY_DN5652_c0_g5_i1.p1 TRINITY_DN5652_c0_g5~~TRINITY_DN5652_c0_g5_i1.p1  ORF type:complete len:528 (+),score=116.22 TRINITY_DN5652_c0_g5_i1:721-2304(+)